MLIVVLLLDLTVAQQQLSCEILHKSFHLDNFKRNLTLFAPLIHLWSRCVRLYIFLFDEVDANENKNDGVTDGDDGDDDDDDDDVDEMRVEWRRQLW